jgi:uncharacterized protein (DUF433 family)
MTQFSYEKQSMLFPELCTWQPGHNARSGILTSFEKRTIIAGTRIKVSQIVIYYERMGKTPDEIVQTHPHLTLAQIHDALSYYYDNAAEINDQIAEERRMVEEKKRGHVSLLYQKRAR